MSEKRVLDFTARLARKRGLEKLTERISVSGWNIDCEAVNLESDLCVYLIDSKESCVILFGCKKDSIPDQELNKNEIVHWGHFVLAWDVIADPSMPFDAKHKSVTMNMALKAIPSLKEWPNLYQKLFNSDEGKTPHLLVVIDRENMESPLDLIVAHSNSQVMNKDSIFAIVKNYISANKGQ